MSSEPPESRLLEFDRDALKAGLQDALRLIAASQSDDGRVYGKELGAIVTRLGAIRNEGTSAQEAAIGNELEAFSILARGLLTAWRTNGQIDGESLDDADDAELIRMIEPAIESMIDRHFGPSS